MLYNAVSGKPPEETTEVDLDSILNAREDVKAVKQSLKELLMNIKTLGFRRLTSKITAQIEEIKPDLVFNLCETLYNHRHKALTEMYVAGWLELLRIPYTGAPPLSVALALNKMRSKQILKAVGLPVPPSIIVPLEEKAEIESLAPPFIVKPVREDGSFGITKYSVVKTQKEAEEQIALVHQNYQQSALVEEYIDGRELTVVIIDNPMRILGIGEVDFSSLPKEEPKIISYRAKWDNGNRLFIQFPAIIEPGLKHRIEKISLKAFKIFGCRDYARIDLRVSENRRPYILEINPNPDMDPNGEISNAAKAANLTYTDVVKHIVESSLARGTRVDFD